MPALVGSVCAARTTTFGHSRPREALVDVPSLPRIPSCLSLTIYLPIYLSLHSCMQPTTHITYLCFYLPIYLPICFCISNISNNNVGKG